MEQKSLTATLTMDPATQDMIQENTTALSIAKSWIVDDADTADLVSAEANKAKAVVKQLDERYRSFITPANQIIDAARGMFKPAIDDLNAAVDHYGTLLVDWRTKEQKRVAAENAAREEEARKIRAAAEQKAAEERAKAAEIARQKVEQGLREAAARQKAEDDARKAAADRQAAIDAGDKQAAEIARKAEAAANLEARRRAEAEAKANEQARAAEDEGAARATQVQLEAEASATSQPAETVREVAGTVFRGKWAAVMTVSEDDAKKAIAAAISSRPELLAYLKLDLVAIGRTATALKANFNVPGFKAELQSSAAKARGA